MKSMELINHGISEVRIWKLKANRYLLIHAFILQSIKNNLDYVKGVIKFLS